jgi:putative phosphoribosyl transferase
MIDPLATNVRRLPVRIPAGDVVLEGDLNVPGSSTAIVLFAHGSGSSRHSPRNKYVAEVLHNAGLATLLFDLLTPAEEQIDARSGHLRFDIELLAKRLVAATEWLDYAEQFAHPFSVGYFGASTGGGAALCAAAQLPNRVHAVVSRGGRPDLAGPILCKVAAPTLLIVGAQDLPVIEMNREALEQMQCVSQMQIVPGATHLFEEPGALERVGELAAKWFDEYLIEQYPYRRL